MALAWLMATLRDWLATCQAIVPVACISVRNLELQSRTFSEKDLHRDLGSACLLSQPSWTGHRPTCGKGGRLACPCLRGAINIIFQDLAQPSFGRIPGCNVESTIFFARHSAGVISLTWPVLYDVMACLACSRPVEPTSNILQCAHVVSAVPRQFRVQLDWRSGSAQVETPPFCSLTLGL